MRMNAASFLSVLAIIAPALAGETADPLDPIAALMDRLDRGVDHLSYKQEFGFLPDLLAHLDVDPESQLLVFSKTSLQYDLISNKAPRAIYFNDRVAVGFVKGAPVLEVMVPGTKGYIFYTVDNTNAAVPRFTHHTDTCGRCHGADAMQPGFIIASTPVEADGTPVFIPTEGPPRLFNFTDQNTPFAERWSGWYVTGTHGAAPHQGNGAVLYKQDSTRLTHLEGTQNLKALDAFFDTGLYLSPGADIVALMTFEHQAQLTNMLLRARSVASLQHSLPSDILEDLIAYMLFADEAALPAPVQGTSAFADHFQAVGPRDDKGRSLRDFELKNRLFKYPLSYMIYSPVFDGLHPEARAQIYRRMHEILSGKDKSSRFSRLAAPDAAAIVEILAATKPEVALSWGSIAAN